MGCRYCGKECYGEFCSLEHRLAFKREEERRRRSLERRPLSYLLIFLLLLGVVGIIMWRMSQ